MLIAKNEIRLRQCGDTGDGVKIAQPDSGMGYNYETTYSEDSGRLQTGVSVVAPLFTVKSYAYSKTHPTVAEVAQILDYIVKGNKYDLYVFDPLTADWGWDTYYTGQGSMTLGYLTADGGHYDSFSFNAVGVNPI